MVPLQLITGHFYLAAAFGIAILAELWHRISLHLPQLVPLGTVSGHKCHPCRGQEDQQCGVHVAVAAVLLTSGRLCSQYSYASDVSTNQSINAATDLPLRDIPRIVTSTSACQSQRKAIVSAIWLTEMTMKWLIYFLHTMETGLFWHLTHDILAFNLGCCNLHPIVCFPVSVVLEK